MLHKAQPGWIVVSGWAIIRMMRRPSKLEFERKVNLRIPIVVAAMDSRC